MQKLTNKQMDKLEREGRVVILFPRQKLVLVDGKRHRYVPEFAFTIARGVIRRSRRDT